MYLIASTCKKVYVYKSIRNHAKQGDGLEKSPTVMVEDNIKTKRGKKGAYLNPVGLLLRTKVDFQEVCNHIQAICHSPRSLTLLV